MNDSPEHIVDILQAGETIHVKPLLQRLRDNQELFETVAQHALEEGLHIDSLCCLKLEMSAPEFILQFRDCSDLESGLWLLPKLQNPFNYDALAGARGIDALAERLQSAQDPQEVAHALANDWGFSGDKRHYHRPENCFLTHCLEHRLGMPITLVSLWILLCQRLGYQARALPCQGTFLVAGMVAMSIALPQESQ